MYVASFKSFLIRMNSYRRLPFPYPLRRQAALPVGLKLILSCRIQKVHTTFYHDRTLKDKVRSLYLRMAYAAARQTAKKKKVMRSGDISLGIR